MIKNIKIKFQNDRFFKNNSFPDMKSFTVSNFDFKEIKRENYFSVHNNISSVSTIQCIIDNRNHHKIIALNFANANIAGGAYIWGGNAQEESLCRASMLYYTIKSQKKYYRKNRLHILPDYTDIMIYSENVPVIRCDNGEILENPVICNFITSPAVNRTFAKFIFSDKNIVKKMTARINKIISLAVSKNPDLIILGAFGCGVFGNKRDVVFKIFENAVNKLVPENIKIIFAVPD